MRPILVVSMILTFFGTTTATICCRVVMITASGEIHADAGLADAHRLNYAQEWGAFAAGAVMGAIPMVAIYLAYCGLHHRWPDRRVGERLVTRNRVPFWKPGFRLLIGVYVPYAPFS